MNNYVFIIIIFIILFLYFFKNKDNFEDYNCIPYKTLKNRANFDRSVPYSSEKIKFKIMYEEDLGQDQDIRDMYSECTQCLPGEYITGSGCQPCEDGSITTEINSFECTACDSDEYTNGPGSSECLKF